MTQPADIVRFPRGAVGLQRFERRRRRFLERRRVFLDGGERFTDSRPEPARNLTQRSRGHLPFAPPAPARRRECRRSCSSWRAIRRRTDCRALAIDPSSTAALAGPHAHTLRNVGSQPRIRRLVHQRQRFPDALLRHQAEERRLLELHRESLSQRVVEHRIAGRVGEIGEHDRVLVGQRRRTAAIDRAGDCRRDDDRCGDRQPQRRAARRAPGATSIAAAGREAAGVAVALQPLQGRRESRWPCW